MLSLEEMSDRFEIQQMRIHCSTAIDRRQFDDLDLVFTSDAYIDYRAMGGIDGRFPEVKAWLAETLPKIFQTHAHMLGNFDVRIEGATASSRTFCFNPMGFAGEQNQIMVCGLWYVDEFLRTPDGWRRRRRVAEKGVYKMRERASPPACRGSRSDMRT